jgi:hypothetical protein
VAITVLSSSDKDDDEEDEDEDEDEDAADEEDEDEDEYADDDEDDYEEEEDDDDDYDEEEEDDDDDDRTVMDARGMVYLLGTENHAVRQLRDLGFPWLIRVSAAGGRDEDRRNRLGFGLLGLEINYEVSPDR